MGMFHSNCISSPGSILLAVSCPVRMNGSKSCLFLAHRSERIDLVCGWVISICLKADSAVQICTALMAEAGKEQPDRTQCFNSNIGDIFTSAASSLDTPDATVQASEADHSGCCAGYRHAPYLYES